MPENKFEKLENIENGYYQNNFGLMPLETFSWNCVEYA